MRQVTLILCLALPASTVAITPSSSIHTNYDAVHRVTTTIVYANGGRQKNEGSGFVVGEKFYTAYHNIQTALHTVADYQIEIGGVVVEPLAVDHEQDLAVFDVPAEICKSWCNELEPAVDRNFDVQEVTWLAFDGDGMVWRKGRFRNTAFKSAATEPQHDECANNLVVEIDQPFVPGTSGGPVFESATGTIVGLIQGSFETLDQQTTGYYKPMKCVLERFQQLTLLP